MTGWLHQIVERAAGAAPDRPAIRDHDGRRVTYGELDALSREAAELLAEHGVGPGDRVAIVGENALSMVALVFGASRLRATFTLLNARLAGSEIERCLAHADPRAILFCTGVSPDAQAHGEARGAKARPTGFGRIAVAARPSAEVDPSLLEEPAVAAILFTTGSTGTPKGVMLTHANLLYAGERSSRLRELAPGDVIYGVLPLTHVFGLASLLVGGLTGGAEIVLVPRFSAERLYEALSSGDVNVFPGVPQMHAALMSLVRGKGMERIADGRLRYLSSGAAPLDPTWKRECERFYGVALQNGYGLTETTAGVCISSNAIGDPDVSVGEALPGMEIALDESVAGGGEGVGEVLTRGPAVMRGYYRNEAATRAAFREDGFLRTGDLGRFDEKGRLHIVGRSKELIIRSGFNVYPPEVEAALNDHPAVALSAVVGRTVQGNEEVIAFVQLVREGAVSAEEIARHAATRLSPYKRPSRIVLATALPAAANGKPLKHLMLAHFAAELAALDAFASKARAEASS